MSHLSPSEFVDLLEGQLPIERARHASSCGVCRSQVEELREALRRSASVPPPEPSPIFWNHFSNRVREGITEPAGRRFDWLFLSRRLAFALALVLVLATIGWRLWPVQRTTDRREELATTNGAASLNPESDPAADRAWEEVRAAAENIAWDDVQEVGIVGTPGSAERAILNLSDSEQRQLMSLIEEELKRSGA
jgi:hypothetical protein